VFHVHQVASLLPLVSDIATVVFLGDYRNCLVTFFSEVFRLIIWEWRGRKCGCWDDTVGETRTVLTVWTQQMITKSRSVVEGRWIIWVGSGQVGTIGWRRDL